MTIAIVSRDLGLQQDLDQMASWFRDEFLTRLAMFPEQMRFGRFHNCGRDAQLTGPLNLKIEGISIQNLLLLLKIGSMKAGEDVLYTLSSYFICNFQTKWPFSLHLDLQPRPVVPAKVIPTSSWWRNATSMTLVQGGVMAESRQFQFMPRINRIFFEGP